MKLDEHGNLVDHHPSCAMQIDPTCRCTCEREENNDSRRALIGERRDHIHELEEKQYNHRLAGGGDWGDSESIKAREIGRLIERISEGTLEQFKAYKTLSDRWAKVGIPQPVLGYPDSWLVEVTGESGSTMWIGIEPDGSTNS